jgi:hypothetical protein
VSGAIEEALVAALGIPPNDFFRIIHVLPRNQFWHTRAFLGLAYSADLILLEITFISGRPREKKCQFRRPSLVRNSGWHDGGI